MKPFLLLSSLCAFSFCYNVMAHAADVESYLRKGTDTTSEGVSYTVTTGTKKEGKNTYKVLTKNDKMVIEDKKDGLSTLIIKNDKGVFLYVPSTKQAARLSRKAILRNPNPFPDVTSTDIKLPPNIKEVNDIIKASSSLPDIAKQSQSMEELRDKLYTNKHNLTEEERIDIMSSLFSLGKKTKRNGYSCQMVSDVASKVDMCLTDKYGLPAYVKIGDSVLNYSNIEKADLKDSDFELPPDVIMTKAVFR